MQIFASIIEEHLFKLVVHRDRALTYKTEEVQLTAVDEIYLEQDLRGAVHRMIARVRIFFLGFFSGKTMPSHLLYSLSEEKSIVI